MTIQEMNEKKRELGYSYEQIAYMSGIPVSTVQKVLGGVTKAPRYETLKALEEVFKEKEWNFDLLDEDVPSSIVREASPYGGKKKQGEYTLEDYYALPDDQRVELIDGVFYEMNAPAGIHQVIGGELFALFREYIRRNKGECLPIMSPIDVQLDCDEKTMVQPDVLILCDRDKLVKRGGVYGAPDFIVEVLSPSTKRKDMIKKNQKYLDAGVKEYWMVDPDEKRIMVYLYDDPDVVHLYSFEDEIPVGIFEGKCKINFAEIYEYIEFMY
jgi:Uma2 family endonuclease